MSKRFEQPPVDDLDALVEGARSRFTEHDGPTAGRHDGKTADRQKTTARRTPRGGSRKRPTPPPPAPAEPAPPSKYTLLLSPDDAAAWDELALALRRQLGARVTKSDVVRALVRLAPDHPGLMDALTDRLRQ